MRSHEELDALRLAIELVDDVYEHTSLMPNGERYGLVTRMQRAGVSVPANIAEGCGRDTTKDLLRHQSISQGSLAELRTLMVVARRRRFLPPHDVSRTESKHNPSAECLSACNVPSVVSWSMKPAYRKPRETSAALALD